MLEDTHLGKSTPSYLIEIAYERAVFSPYFYLYPTQIIQFPQWPIVKVSTPYLVLCCLVSKNLSERKLLCGK